MNGGANSLCAVCSTFLDTHDDECYELDTWNKLVIVDEINDLSVDDIVYCSKSCYKWECKITGEVA